MSILIQIIIAAAYSVLALAAAFVLPERVPQVTPLYGAVAGAVVMIGGLVLQFGLALRRQSRRAAFQLEDIRKQTRLLAEDLLETQTQSLHWRQAAEQMGKAGEQRVSQVISEVKVLQGLIETFAEQQTRYAAAAAGGSVAQLVALEGGKSEKRPDMPPVQEIAREDETLVVLREALRSDRVDVYLQPIVSLPQRKTRYYECYTRIRTEDGSVIGPGSYIGVAEREGMVGAIDNLLLFRCVQLIRRTRNRDYDVSFFCNISGESLGDTRFISDFVDFVADNPELAPNILFEIGQSDLDNAPPESIDNLARLAQLGFRFSLDQVTHLNLNFSGLAARSFRFVKVDARYLLDSDIEVQSDIVVTDIKKQLDRYGLNMIVEKIEQESDLVELLDLEVDYGQGYLFGEPRLSRVD
ncbi:MAG: EAL domain-containing protein [Alphaproteobacteria bacterium]|nr:EAL domain-containing protein [Alphaproteobacteria bacterium]